MKKQLIGVLLLSALVLTGCSDSLSQKIHIQKPMENSISKQGNYSLDCKTHNYTSIIIGGEIMDETYIRVQEGHDRDTIYVEGNTAKYFGADYNVIYDDNRHLVIMRTYGVSGLTEVVSIDKKSGIGFDTKTLTSGISLVPNTYTYLLSCIEV